MDELRQSVSRVDLSGRFAVIQTYWPYDMCSYLVEEGVIGLIVISTVPSGLIANYTALFDGLPETPLSVPGVVIDQNAGANLTALVGAMPETVVKVTHRVEYRQAASANVVGRNWWSDHGAHRRLRSLRHTTRGRRGPGQRDRAR